MPTIVIYGPAGCGKTFHREALLKHFGCAGLCDEYDGSRLSVVPGHLHFCNHRPAWSGRARPATAARGADLRVIDFYDACAEAGITPHNLDEWRASRRVGVPPVTPAP